MPVRIEATGGLVVTVGRRRTHPAAQAKSARKLRELVAVLVAEPNGATQADLADWLWPDAEGDRAAASLKVAIHRARQWLGSDAILVEDGCVRLDAADRRLRRVAPVAGRVRRGAGALRLRRAAHPRAAAQARSPLNPPRPDYRAWAVADELPVRRRRTAFLGRESDFVTGRALRRRCRQRETQPGHLRAAGSPSICAPPIRRWTASARPTSLPGRRSRRPR